MTSLLESDRIASSSALSSEPQAAISDPEAAEFEIVLGRRQMASLGLLALVMLAVFSGVSYLIGKSVAPKSAVSKAAQEASVEVPVPPAPAVQAIAQPPATVSEKSTPEKATPQKAVPAEATLAKAPEPASAQVTAPESPLYADPVPGGIYLQMGAVEKGVAAIWAEGLRIHHLAAFVAPGPSEKIFRVLIGPLPDPAAYQEAKKAVTQLELTTFARRFEAK